MSIKVVNLRDYKVEKGWVLVKVDRSSVLGNPFRMVNERDRSRVCDEYEKYFMKRVNEEGDFRNEVIRIYKLVKSGKNVALGCWCFPRRCHALVIKRFIESCLEESKGSSSSKGEKMEFRGKYWFLSNFYPCKVSFGNLEFGCVEAAFQSAKCKNAQDRQMFVGLNGAEAKKLGRKVELRTDWDKVKDDVMFALVSEKFENAELKAKLKAVKGEIVENNNWNDTYWGVCNGRGLNKLGKILMEVRKSAK